MTTALRRSQPTFAERRRSRDTRAKIVGAALAAFAERGFDGARTRDIAARAGVNQGLITYHFSNKQDLWKAAVDRIFALLREEFTSRLALLEDADPLTRARLLIRHFVRFAAVHPELHRLMVEEGKSDGARMQWLVDRHVRPLYETSCSLLKTVRAEGALPRLAPLHLHYMLIGAAAHLFVMAPECRRLTGQDPMDESVIETHAEAIVTLLLGPASAAKKTRSRR
jgi:TetR/AcrR family transcriptional regulator